MTANVANARKLKVLGSVSMLRDIRKRLNDENPIARKTIMDWMTEVNDLEAMGALFTLITDPKSYARITPILAYRDYSDFVLYYFARCLEDNPDGEWAHTRYEAAHEFREWFLQLWSHQEKVRCQDMDDSKHWLANVYKGGDSDVRETIVFVVLEHLLEDEAIREYFSDWQDDATLLDAYCEASDWGNLKNLRDLGPEQIARHHGYGSYDEMIELRRRRTRDRPNDVRLSYEYIQALVIGGQLDEAIEEIAHFERALRDVGGRGQKKLSLEFATTILDITALFMNAGCITPALQFIQDNRASLRGWDTFLECAAGLETTLRALEARRDTPQ